MGRVLDLIADKDQTVHTVTPDSTVLEAIRKMNRHRIGALVVVDPVAANAVVGMFTERDVLRLVGALQDVSHILLRDVMTRDVMTVVMNTEIDEVQDLMRTRRVRHLPVIDHEARLIGLVSIGDLNAWCVIHQAKQLEQMSEYIYGRV